MSALGCEVALKQAPLGRGAAARLATGDIEAMALYAGQGVGVIDTVEPAAAIVERFAAAL